MPGVPEISSAKDDAETAARELPEQIERVRTLVRDARLRLAGSGVDVDEILRPSEVRSFKSRREGE